MPRLDGVDHEHAGLFARIVYFMTKRRLGRVIAPIKIKAHHPRLLRGYVHMELGQQAAHALPAQLKTLADVKVAKMIGCPF